MHRRGSEVGGLFRFGFTVKPGPLFIRGCRPLPRVPLEQDFEVSRRLTDCYWVGLAGSFLRSGMQSCMVLNRQRSSQALLTLQL